VLNERLAWDEIMMQGGVAVKGAMEPIGLNMLFHIGKGLFIKLVKREGAVLCHKPAQCRNDLRFRRGASWITIEKLFSGDINSDGKPMIPTNVENTTQSTVYCETCAKLG